MTRNSKSDDSSSLYFSGNLSNTIMILNTLSFLGFMLFPSSLSTSYTSDGFCVSSPGSLFSSHYLCFYVDTITSILLYLFAKKYEKIHGIEKIIQTLPGILAHGLGHLALGYHYPPSSLIISDRSLLFRLLSSLGMSLFFYFMFLSVPNLSNQKSKIVPISIIYGVININFLPPTFSFTFVQSALLLTVGYFDMVNPDKPAFYNPWSILVNTPISFVGWLEALKCDEFVRAIGGHLIYDATIPLSVFVYGLYMVNTAPKSKSN